MRTVPLMVIVISLGLSLMVLGGLGINQHFGADGETGLQEEIDETTGEEESLDPEEGDDGGFFSFVVGGLSTMRDMFGIMLYMPSTLQSLGLPPVVSRALGHGIQIAITIGLVQIALQYDIR